MHIISLNELREGDTVYHPFNELISIVLKIEPSKRDKQKIMVTLFWSDLNIIEHPQDVSNSHLLKWNVLR